MAKNNENDLLNVLAGVIRGVIDGDIEPSQANAISATTAQMVKIAKLKLEHQRSAIDQVFVPRSNLVSSAITSEDSLRESIYRYISEVGEATFKQIAKHLQIQWEVVDDLCNHENFKRIGNKVSIAN